MIVLPWTETPQQSIPTSQYGPSNAILVRVIQDSYVFDIPTLDWQLTGQQSAGGLREKWTHSVGYWEPEPFSRSTGQERYDVVAPKVVPVRRCREAKSDIPGLAGLLVVSHFQPTLDLGLRRCDPRLSVLRVWICHCR